MPRERAPGLERERVVDGHPVLDAARELPAVVGEADSAARLHPRLAHELERVAEDVEEANTFFEGYHHLEPCKTK